MCLSSVLRPNTPHAIFSLENTVVEGGYFYATSTIQDTSYALIHHFLMPHIASPLSPSHSKLSLLDCSRFLLRQMVIFWATELMQPDLEDDGSYPYCSSLLHCN